MTMLRDDGSVGEEVGRCGVKAKRVEEGKMC